MEVEHLLVPSSYWLHISIGLVSNAMVDELQLDSRKELVDWLIQMMFFISWQEDTGVLVSLDKSVSCISICLNH